MSKPKFASLTAGLLARKGEAVPTAQPFASLVPALPTDMPEPEPMPSRPAAGGGLAALIQRARPPAPLAEVAPQPERTVQPATVPAQRPAPIETSPVAPPPEASRPRVLPFGRRHAANTEDAESKSAICRRHGVTVRLDGPRYRRLMVVSVRYGRTYQDILARALDVYMTALGIDDPGAPATPSTRKRW